MKRETLCMVGGLVLSAAVIGWLLNENQSLRERLTGQNDAGGPSTSHAEATGGKQAKSSESDGASVAGNRQPDASGKNHFRGDRQRPKTETEPGGVTVVRIQDKAGSLHRTEENLTVNENQVQPTTTVVQAESALPSLLKNGGFDGELAPWVCENGKLVRDPDDAKSTVLEVRLDDPGFQLSQTFQPLSGKKDLTLSLRTKFRDPREGEHSFFGLHLSFNGGKTLIYDSRISAVHSGEWTIISIGLSELPNIPDTLAIESIDGSGTVWIDDVTLK